MTEAYKIVDGIKCYAPELAFSNNDFQAQSFDVLYKLENRNFWYISRNEIIRHFFEKYVGKDVRASVLEIGCGTGYVLSGLSRFANYKLMGAEIYLEGLKYAQKRLPGVEFIQLDATVMSFQDEFDTIGAFDVLEHIEEDEKVMKNVFRSLKQGGYFFVTVPQYMFMWSLLDDIDRHKRRYSKRELHSKLRKNGFEIIYSSSFVFTLFPLMLISRLFKKRKLGADVKLNKEMALSGYDFPPLVNSIFKMFMLVDLFLIRAGVSLPFGGSLIAVAKKV